MKEVVDAGCHFAVRDVVVVDKELVQCCKVLLKHLVHDKIPATVEIRSLLLGSDLQEALQLTLFLCAKLAVGGSPLLECFVRAPY